MFLSASVPSASTKPCFRALSYEPVDGFDQTCIDTLLGGRKKLISLFGTLSSEPVGSFNQACADNFLGGWKKLLDFGDLDLSFKVTIL